MSLKRITSPDVLDFPGDEVQRFLLHYRLAVRLRFMQGVFSSSAFVDMGELDFGGLYLYLVRKRTKGSRHPSVS